MRINQKNNDLPPLNKNALQVSSVLIKRKIQKGTKLVLAVLEEKTRNEKGKKMKPERLLIDVKILN